MAKTCNVMSWSLQLVFGCCERWLRVIFYHYGVFMGKYPVPFLLCPLILMLCAVVGFQNMQEEDRIWYLYSPSYAASHYEHQVAREFFQDEGDAFETIVAVMAK